MITFCSLCQCKHNDMNWKYREGNWICSKYFKPRQIEYITDDMSKDREKYFKSALQPFRSGELSKEYVEAYPQSVNRMLKEKSISQKEVNNAKYVYKDLAGFKNRHKSF